MFRDVGGMIEEQVPEPNNGNSPRTVGDRDRQVETIPAIPLTGLGQDGSQLPGYTWWEGKETTTAAPGDPGLVFSRTDVPVDEGSTAVYTVALATQPGAEVIVSITGAGPGVGVGRTSLGFTTANWSTAQTFGVGVSDRLVRAVVEETLAALAEAERLMSSGRPYAGRYSNPARLPGLVTFGGGAMGAATPGGDPGCPMGPGSGAQRDCSGRRGGPGSPGGYGGDGLGPDRSDSRKCPVASEPSVSSVASSVFRTSASEWAAETKLASCRERV